MVENYATYANWGTDNKIQEGIFDVALLLSGGEAFDLIGGIGKFSWRFAAKGGGRAFFSGIGTEARAIEQGFQTLGQTRAGINLAKLTKGMPYYGPINGQPASQAWQMWARLSTAYAKGINNGSTVTVFLNNPSSTGIWNLVEKGLLEAKGVNFIIK